jgi:hypothetical protein
MQSLTAVAAKARVSTNLSVNQRRFALRAGAVLVIWAVFVAFGLLHHAYWRDEVRALTMALQAPNLFEVPSAIHGEGHPALWYILLRAAYDLTNTRLVLPIMGIAAAAAGILLFIWKAPFPLWWKALFVFSGLSIYEYSIMARNYGISMPLMFAIALLMTRRPRVYWALAVTLFLLPQTNISSAILAPLYVLILLVGWREGERRDRIGIFLCAIATVIGLAAAFATVYPPRHDMITQWVSGQTSFMSAIFQAIVNPGGENSQVMYPSLLMYASALALLPDLVLLGVAVLAVWGTSLFYNLVYPWSSYRHFGILLVFYLSLYWIRYAYAASFLPKSRAPLSWLRWLSLGPFTLVLAMNVLIGAALVVKESQQEWSMSRALGRMIASDPELRRAILLPEPEEIGEALAYYTDNDMFLARESRWGKFATWSRETKQDISLGNLLATAEMLISDTKRPVLILIGPHLTGAGDTVAVSLTWRFSYTSAEFAELSSRATRLPLPRNAMVENFDAYLMK